MFPRVDIAPSGAWIATDCNPDGSVFVETSAGIRMELGPRQPNNPACPRYQSDGLGHVYMVAWDGANVFGRHLVFDELGEYVEERPHFDATQGIAMGILDVTFDGQILWWNGNSARTVDGLTLLNWRERGDFIVGVLADTWLGISVYEKSSARWFRAFPYDVQLFAGIAVNGTVSAQGEGGGFIPRSAWLASPFDPHHVDHDDAPHTDHADVPHTDHADAPHTDHADVPHTDQHTDVPEPTMTRNAVLVDEVWYEVEELPHPDAGPEFGPVVGVSRVTDGFMLKVRGNGVVEFEAGTPGADERCIPVDGAYVAIRDDVVIVIEKAGPWSR